MKPLPALVAGATFLLCALLAAPGLTWLDGGELSLAAGTMGVAHPPGEPAYLVLARLAALIPVGDLPFRLTVLSATTVAVAAGLLASIVAEAAGRLTSWRKGATVPVAGLFAGLLFGAAPAVVLQGVRPELYGLTVALGLASVRLLQLGGRRAVALAVLPLAVAGAVHHAMLVAALPGLALLATGRGRGAFRAALGCALLIVVPALLQFAWLPLRSVTDPALDFGAPRTLARVIHAVTAAGYARSFQPTGAQVVANLWAHLRMVVSDLGPVAAVLAAGGLAVGWRARRRYLVGALLIVAVGVLPTVLQGLFREDNPDARGYLLGPYAVVCAGAALGGVALLDRARQAAPRLAPLLGTALLAGLVVPATAASLRVADHSGRTLPARIGSAVLDGAAPGALVLLAGDSWALPAIYLRYWEGRRPDLHVLPLHMLEPAALPGLAARGVPVPAALPEEERARIDAVHRGLVPEHLLLALVDGRRIGATVQVNDAFLPLPLLSARYPDGLLYRLGQPVPGWRDAEERAWSQTVEPAQAEPGYRRDAVGQGALSRRYGARGGFHRSRGERHDAGVAYGRGSALEPDDSAMIQLMRWRFDEGLEARGYGQDDVIRYGTASRLTMEGELGQAREVLGELLARHPVHPEGLLLAERLYSLGVHAAPPVPMPEGASEE